MSREETRGTAEWARLSGRSQRAACLPGRWRGRVETQRAGSAGVGEAQAEHGGLEGSETSLRDTVVVAPAQTHRMNWSDP